jgi:hypothetical protein
MFYGQCWKCGERWGLGTASTCKCPDEEPVKFAFRENNDSTEVLRVTPEGEFIWHPDADKLLAEGDFSQSPALPHILKALRKQRTQPEQEPVAWMDGYRNIYSLEEKAAGCPEATIPLVPIANQQKTSGSPIFSELHCICGAEWEWHNHDWELVTTPQPQQAEKQEPFGWVSQHTVKGPYEWQFNN